MGGGGENWGETGEMGGGAMDKCVVNTSMPFPCAPLPTSTKNLDLLFSHQAMEHLCHCNGFKYVPMLHNSKKIVLRSTFPRVWMVL